MVKIASTLVFLLCFSGCAFLKNRITSPELHVIGIHEGADPEEDGQPWWSKCDGGLSRLSEAVDCRRKMESRKQSVVGEVVVNVSITDRPLILAFSAYNKTKWIVKVDKDVDIRKIILSGYHSQSMSGIPDNIPIEVYTYDASPCPRCWQGNRHFYSYKSPPPALKEIADSETTSWQGRYTGKEFSIFPGIKKYHN